LNLNTLPISVKPQTDNYRAENVVPALSVSSQATACELVTLKNSSPQETSYKQCEKGQYVILKRTEGYITIFKKVYIQCNTWSCPVCSARKRKNLYKKVNDQTNGKKFKLLTLTLRQNNDGLAYNWKRLAYCWDILIKRLHRKNPNMKYFKVVELQENGMPHIHALVDTWIGNVQLKLFWRRITGDSFICRFETIRFSAVGYIMKYFDFACNDIDTIREMTGAKTKLYTMSKNFLIKDEKSHIWHVEFFSKYSFEIDEYMERVIASLKYKDFISGNAFQHFVFEDNPTEFHYVDTDLYSDFLLCEPF